MARKNVERNILLRQDGARHVGGVTCAYGNAWNTACGRRKWRQAVGGLIAKSGRHATQLVAARIPMAVHQWHADVEPMEACRWRADSKIRAACHPIICRPNADGGPSVACRCRTNGGGLIAIRVACHPSCCRRDATGGPAVSSVKLGSGIRYTIRNRILSYKV